MAQDLLGSSSTDFLIFFKPFKKNFYLNCKFLLFGATLKSNKNFFSSFFLAGSSSIISIIFEKAGFVFSSFKSKDILHSSVKF